MIEAILLGIAQDAGVPQLGCACPRCLAAQAHPTLVRHAVSLGLVHRASGQMWLVDATPDIRPQLHRLRLAAPGCQLAGILLTHAHMGHYTGLMHLGREGWNSRRLPVYASPAMIDFLSANLPWRQLVELENIVLHPLAPDVPLALAADLRVTAVPVPHRNEWSDTLGFVLCGPTRRLFYCPDIDDWTQWDRDLATFLANERIDIALLDGCFFSPAELPGRNLAEIPHPFATQTVAQVAGSPCQVGLIHLNHTNPLLDDGPDRAWVMEQGVAVPDEGDRWDL